MAPSERDLQVQEYHTTHELMAQSMTRLWQSVTVAGAAYAAVTYVLVNVLPSGAYPFWLKIWACWLSVGVTLAINSFLVLVLLRETFWQEVAYRRMLALERLLGFKLARAGERMEQRASREKRLRTRLGRLAVGHSLSRPVTVPALFVMLALVQALIVVAATLVTVSLV